MRPLFRWQTEEKAWDAEQPGAKSRKSRWAVIIVVGILLLGAALFYGQQMRQIQSEERLIEANVLASHNTWVQAVAAADFDLFVHLIDNQNPQWQNAQRDLLQQGALLDRQALGLNLQPGVASTAVTLAPNWQQATVTFDQTYTAVADNQTNALIQLQQTFFYQLDESRWPQAAHNAELWGETPTFEGTWVTLQYPVRVETWALRLANDLEAALAAVCAEKSCATGVTVRLDTEPDSLAKLQDLLTPVFDGRSHILPTFTLVGLPLDDASYQALYRGYTQRIITAFESNLDSPLPLPEQAIETICFPETGGAPHLYRYDLANDTWQAELPNQPFRFLSPLPDDSGLIISDLPSSSEASRLTLRLWQAGQSTLLFDDTDPARQWRFPQIGWGGQTQPPRVLLHEFDTVSQTRTLYGWLDLTRCNSDGCVVTDLPGYTLWSPNGRSSIVVIGSEIWLGDGQGTTQQLLDRGSTPFWLDDKTFGYTRYQPQLELVVATTENPNPVAVLDEAGVTTVLTDPNTGTPSISHITTHPTQPGLLVLAGPEIRGAGGKYNIFTFQFSDWAAAPAGKLTLRLQLDDPPLGYPTVLTPSGVPPISFSPNGRWLVAAQISDPPDDSWQIHLHDIAANQTQIVKTSSPRYPANTPFFDWSSDSQWLILVDDGFLKLIAPAAGYERIILHEYDACYFTAWVNQ